MIYVNEFAPSKIYKSATKNAVKFQGRQFRYIQTPNGKLLEWIYYGGYEFRLLDVQFILGCEKRAISCEDVHNVHTKENLEFVLGEIMEKNTGNNFLLFLQENCGKEIKWDKEYSEFIRN